MKALDSDLRGIARRLKTSGHARRSRGARIRSPIMTNPLDDSDVTRQQRIRERAYHLWEQEGRPDGRDADYWERARELVGMEESSLTGQVPVRGDIAEEASIQSNLGEFPDRLADQGEHAPTPD